MTHRIITATAQGNSTSFTGVTATVNPKVAIPNGALIIVCTCKNNLLGNNTLTDAAGNGYTRVPSCNLKLSADSCNSEIWWSANSNALGTTQAITYTSGGASAGLAGVVTVASVTGLTNEENFIFDDVVTTANSVLLQTANAPLRVNANTPTTYEEFHFGVNFMVLSATNETATNDPNWTALPQAATGNKAGDQNLMTAYKIVTTDNLAQTYNTHVSSANTHWAGAVVAFRTKFNIINATWIG